MPHHILSDSPGVRSVILVSKSYLSAEGVSRHMAVGNKKKIVDAARREHMHVVLRYTNCKADRNIDTNRYRSNAW